MLEKAVQKIDLQITTKKIKIMERIQSGENPDELVISIY